MTLRNSLVCSAASCALFCAVAAFAAPQDFDTSVAEPDAVVQQRQMLHDYAKSHLDAAGKPCAGELDGAHRCIPAASAVNTPDHPYRRSDESDARNSGPGKAFGRRNRDLIYIAVPGGGSNDPNSEVKTGEGIIVLDARAGYAFVNRIHLQNITSAMTAELISAMMASPATNMLYVSTRGHLIAMDLATDKVVWSNSYEPGTCCERGQVTPDGLTLEVGSDVKNFHRIIDARTGKIKAVVPTPLSMFNHNMGMSTDGKTAFDAAQGLTMTMVDMDTAKATGTISFSDHIRVFVLNHDSSRVYANLNNLMGFEIADVASRKVIKRVEVPGEMWKAKWADPNQHFFGHGAPMHGIAFTPDESEIWLPSGGQNNDGTFTTYVYDNPVNGNWPVLNSSKTFKTNYNAGWITMGLDGKIALMASGDVVDVKTHKIIAQLKDEYGNLIHSEKFLEMDFDGKEHLRRTVNQFAEALPGPYQTRVAAQQARN